jgi:adenylylsulfate kinase
VIWITGYSGAGKTTVAEATRRLLDEKGQTCVVLDGDRLRAVLAPDAGHSPEERLRLALTYSRLCKELADQGLTVICATISMFEEVWAWNRANMVAYLEVYLRVPLAERAARDPKGLYARNTKDMVGVDVALAEPTAPHLTIDNCGPLDAQHAAEQIVTRIVGLPDAGASRHG